MCAAAVSMLEMPHFHWHSPLYIPSMCDRPDTPQGFIPPASRICFPGACDCHRGGFRTSTPGRVTIAWLTWHTLGGSKRKGQSLWISAAGPRGWLLINAIWRQPTESVVVPVFQSVLSTPRTIKGGSCTRLSSDASCPSW